jgi:hypothetical protein
MTAWQKALNQEWQDFEGRTVGRAGEAAHSVLNGLRR